MTVAAGRTLDLNMNLLDRQVIDNHGRLVCKVDDLELTEGADGALYVAAILVGPRAIGPRLGGRLGRWVTSIAARLSDSAPPRIDASYIADIDSVVTLTVPVEQLPVTALEQWIDRHLISRIPGSRHESQ